MIGHLVFWALTHRSHRSSSNIPRTLTGREKFFHEASEPQRKIGAAIYSAIEAVHESPKNQAIGFVLFTSAIIGVSLMTCYYAYQWPVPHFWPAGEFIYAMAGMPLIFFTPLFEPLFKPRHALQETARLLLTDPRTQETVQLLTQYDPEIQQVMVHTNA